MKTTIVRKAIAGCLVLSALSALPALAQDDEDAERRTERQHFKFHFDGDSLDLGNFAMRFTPPDLSGLEALEDLHLDFREPMALWFGDEPHVLLREHSEVAKLEKESRELARKAREVEGAERQELEEELRQTLEEIFEAKMELRRERVEQLEERLQKERDELQRRGAARESMIDRRLNRLLGEDDALDW